MSVELQRKLSSILQRGRPDYKSLVVTVHPDVMQRLRKDDGEHLVAIERKYEARLTFRSDPSFNRDHFTILTQGGEEVKEGR
jgi:ribonuclease G